MLNRRSVLEILNDADLERQAVQCYLKAGDGLANFMETGEAEWYNAFLWFDDATRVSYDVLNQRKYLATGENYCHVAGSMPGEE